MRKMMIASLAAAMLADATVRVEHNEEEITADDLVKAMGNLSKAKPKPRKPEPIYLRPPQVKHRDKSPALARMLKSKGRK